MGFIVISLQTAGIALALLAGMAAITYIYMLAVYMLHLFLKKCREAKVARKFFTDIEGFRNDFTA